MRAGVLRVVLVLALLLAAAPPLAAQEEGESEGEWTTTPFFYWAGPVSGGNKALSILINDEEPKGRRLHITEHGGVVHVRLLLELELNHVVIAQGEKVLYERFLFYAPSYNDLLVPEEMPVYIFHTEENEAPCRRCHRLEPSSEDRRPASPAKSICYPCHHEEMGDRQRLHPTSAQWRCLICHQPGFEDSDLYPDAPVRYTVAEIAEIAVLCYKCHRQEASRFAGYEYVHGPVGEGACIFCHDPHGSAQPKFLHLNATKLCVDCHDLGEMLERPVVHPVLRKQGCTACHDPHGSNHMVQLRQEIEPLCFSCHKRMREYANNHPVNGHPTSGRPDPRDPQRSLTCVSCHNPHGSDADKLLPEEDAMMVCLDCHQMNMP